MSHQTAHMSRLTQIAPSDCRIHVAFKVSKVDSASAPGLQAQRARDRLPSRQTPCAPPPRGRRRQRHATSSSPACWSTRSSSSSYAACIDVAPPAARVLGSAATLRGGTADDVSGRAFGFMAQGCRRHGGDGREIVGRSRRAPACATAAAAY